jgi:TetR/AcrR family hemagglutinin/protease transcriptional regulator
LSKVARRKQLLDHAVRIGAEVSIARITHADVAKAEHVAVATVFSYFPNRQALVDAILNEVRVYFVKLLKEVPRDQPARSTLFSMLWNSMQTAEHDPQYLRVWIEWGATMRAETWPQYLQAQKQAAAILEKVLVEGQKRGDIDPRLDAGVAARILADGSRWVASMIFSDIHEDAIKMVVWNWVDSALQLGLTNDFVKAISKSSNRKSRRLP